MRATIDGEVTRRVAGSRWAVAGVPFPLRSVTPATGRLSDRANGLRTVLVFRPGTQEYPV